MCRAGILIAAHDPLWHKGIGTIHENKDRRRLQGEGLVRLIVTKMINGNGGLEGLCPPELE